MDTKKLRQKILDLAIRGKLVPQDPNDEPASVLLDRIRAEKERLIADGKIKRPKKSKPTSAESHYPKFPIPASWQWTTLGEIFSMQAGKSIQSSELESESDEAPFPCYGGNGIRGYLRRKSHSGVYPIIGRQGALCGNINLAQGEFYATEHAVVVSYFAHTEAELWKYFLEYLNLNQYATATAQPGLSVAKIEEVPIPLPPFKEQKRILDALSVWFSLVDRIESGRQSLSDYIHSAKSKILELAMQGKLVAQDPSDEPAADMLRRVNPKARIIPDNPHYPQLPDNWVWTKLSNVAILLSGRDLTNEDCNDKREGIPYLIGASNIENGQLKFVRWTEHPQVLSVDDDILLSCKGTIGEIVLNQHGKIHIARQFMAIRSGEAISTDYLIQVLKAQLSLIRKKANGIIPGISRPILLELDVPLPPISEQVRIIKRIDEMFNSLDLIQNSLN